VSDGARERGASKVVARNAAVRTVGEVVAKLASVVFFVAAARKLGEGAFGDFMFAVSLSTILFLIAGFGTEELLTREVSRDRDRIHDYLSNVVAVKAVSSIALFGVGVVIVNLGSYSGEVRLAFYLVAGGIALENFGRTWGSVFQAYERMEYISAVLILQRLVTAVAGVAVLAAGGGLVAVSGVYTGAALLGFVVGAWALRRYVVQVEWRVDRSRWVSIARAGVPIGMLAVLSMTLIKLDQTLISFLGGDDANVENGFYGAAFRLVEATLFISWSFSAAMLPWLSRQEQADGGDGRLAGGYAFALKALAAVLLPIAVVFMLLAHPIVDLVYGAQYAEAVPSLQLLGAMTFFFGINEFAAILLISRDRPGSFTKLLGGVVVLNVVSNVILIPPHGATGAATSALISGVVLAVFGLVLARRVVGPINPVRALLAPGLAAGAMAAAIALTGQHLLSGVVVGGLTYVVALLAVERLAFAEDFGTFASLLRSLTSRRGTPEAV
jgi:O-antigen/teichoic acid export membrane protein